MKVLLSPAKKLDFSKSTIIDSEKNYIFPLKTEKLKNVLKTFSVKKFGELMKLSPQLSDLNYQRFQLMGSELNEKSHAGFAFNGEVYSGLDIESFSENDLKEAEGKLRILSGLYGVLTPSTLIEPYRLEMGTKLVVEGNKNLYDFWGDDIIDFLQNEEKEVIINLASNEYNKAAKLKKFDGTVITPIFKEFKNGNYKVIMVYAKRARGMMAQWIIKNRIEKYNEVKNFTLGGYVFSEELSSEDEWVFTR
tara:strand:- start:615 stop:1361 length:747 start_codon:yes stop_codon:yes gene_type:complete